MFKSPEEKFSISVNNGTDLMNMIIKYVASLDTINHYNAGKFKIETITDENETTIKKYDLILKSPYGKYTINYNNSNIIFDYRVDNTIIGTQYHADIYSILYLSSNESKEILLDFIETARKYNEVIPKEIKNEFISVYQFDTQHLRWCRLSQLKKRNIDSVYLDKDKLENLKEDMDNFMNSEEEYAKYGIPYKRNYLLYGLPGTGKTSLIFALASLYNMSVAIFSFVPNIDDAVFMKCINSLSNNAILVLEDIDGLFSDRYKDYNNKSMISFSGVLNTLDGMGRKDKLITFLTTNHKQNLDQAILRPGRIDYKLEFTYASNYQLRKMYEVYIGDDNIELFIKKFKNMKITTCVLQKFFFEHRNENIMDKLYILEDLINAYSEFGKNLYT